MSGVAMALMQPVQMMDSCGGVSECHVASCSGRSVVPGKWRRRRGLRLKGRSKCRGTTNRFCSRHQQQQQHLCSSMFDAWGDSRDSARILWRAVYEIAAGRHRHCPVIVNEIAGQYEDSYEDVDKHLLDYFTFKAVRTVLAQLYEMNPGQYIWFYNFVANNKPQDSKVFIRSLVKERQELAERVMVTRLHLFSKWVKKYSHENMYNAISDQNLELLRERLVQTVKLPSDGEDFQKK